VLHLRRHREGDVKSIEHGNLDDHRKTPAEWIHSVLAVELHSLSLHALRVALVLGAKRIDLGLERLHRLHRAHALQGQREEEHLCEHGEEDDRDAVVVGVAMEPPEHPEDGHGDPLHGEPTVGLRHRETTEIYGLFQSYAIGLQPIVLLRTEVSENAAVPGLTGLEDWQGSPQPSVYGITDLALSEAELRRLRDQRAQIPLALEADPLALAHEVRELPEILV